MSLNDKYKQAAVDALKEAEYQEIFGLNFSTDPSTWTKAHENVLLKFWTANEGKLAEAKEQLLKTLKWRKEFNPLKAATETHSPEIVKLGVVTRSPKGKIVTWNLYGAVKDPGAVFAKLDEFIRWRIGLHERAIGELDFADPELSSMDQVHDYMNVSFLRMDSRIRKSVSVLIKMFQDYYPETLSAKYFVNVPYIMMWAFRLSRALTSEATQSKFHVLANGNQLYKDLGDWVPKVYGGTGPDLRSQEIHEAQKPEELD